MNRYALWKYLVILTAVLLGTLYTLPNFLAKRPPCRSRLPAQASNLTWPCKPSLKRP